MPDRDSTLLLQQAKNGDKDSRNQLIGMYRPFILKITSQTCKRFVRLGEDDEVSIALIAFNEAIDSFQQEKGHAFLSFAETVIRRRLIDYFRKEARNGSIPVSGLDEENRDALSAAETAAAVQRHSIHEETADRQVEIKLFTQELAYFNITLPELAKISPRHETARRRAMEAAALIAADQEMLAYLYRKKALPLKELDGRSKLSRKTLERQRKYIIAVAVVLAGDYRHLREYIKKVL